MRVAVYWRAAGVALALRPLRCVFSGAELALLLLLALLLDEWATHAQPPRVEGAAEKPPRRIADTTTRAEVKAALRTMTRKRADVITGPTATPTARDACCCEFADCESTDSCSTADTALLSVASPCSRHDSRAQASQREAALFTSMAISRFSDDTARDVAFLHKSGELQMRRESVLNVFKPWRKCSILLSVTSGELFVHRKAKAPPEVFPLSRFTGACVLASRHHAFKVVFDGHSPLSFRTASAEDAECWVAALEYAKEATWRAWA